MKKLILICLGLLAFSQDAVDESEFENSCDKAIYYCETKCLKSDQASYEKCVSVCDEEYSNCMDRLYGEKKGSTKPKGLN